MNNNPLVSILLLSMNHEKFIGQCIASLKEQTYKNFEVIYLDNASSDSTFEIGKKLLKESGIPHKVFFNTESKRISKNLNFLLDNSSGLYICPLSADDWFASENIEKKVAFYQKKPETGALFSNGWNYYEEEKNMVLNDSSNFRRGNLFRDILTHPDCIFYVGVIYNRKIFEKIGKWDESLLIEDVDMYIRLGLVSYIDYIDEPLVYYRKNSKSTSKNKSFMLAGFHEYYEKYKGVRWINMKKWLAERYRSFAASCIDNKEISEAMGFLLYAAKLNPLCLKNFRTLFYLIRQTL